MFRTILKPLLILIALNAALIGVVHSEPASDADLRALIVSSCATSCWQGIEVGVTTREQATRILEANPWVERVYQTTIAVTWRWNGKQPTAINGAKDGLLQITGDIVRQIRIQTLIPFGDVWLMLDRPDDALLVQPLTHLDGYQIAFYNQAGIQAINSFSCPVTPSVFWSATITLGMGAIWSTEGLNSRSLNIYRSPGWWTHLRRC